MPRTVYVTLRRYAAAGHVNGKITNPNGGQKRQVIGSAAIEQELLTNKVLQDMASLSLDRRVDLIRQKWGADCNK